MFQANLSSLGIPGSRAHRASLLGMMAKKALIAEAELTPKPGLVDQRGPGAHSDISFDLMKRSAQALEPFFIAMAFTAADATLNSVLREALANIGRSAEQSMLESTGGSNTHKGAIWILGLFVAAASRTTETESLVIAETAGSIARLPTRYRPELLSHGDLVHQRYGVTGARGEAVANFPHVMHCGLPALRKAREAGRSEPESQLHSLLTIMAELDDTCVLYRGGSDGGRAVKAGANLVLHAGGPGTAAGDAALCWFDRELLEKRLSPGGSADLLAASLFLDYLAKYANFRQEATLLREEMDGKD